MSSPRVRGAAAPGCSSRATASRPHTVSPEAGSTATSGADQPVAARGAHGFVFAYGVLGVFTVLATVAAARVVADGTPEPPLENPDISVVIGSPLC